MSLSLNALLADLEKDASIVKTAADTTTVKPAISAELSGILEKKASTSLIEKAGAAGEELARQLLEKLANDIIAGNNEMVMDDDKKVTPNETGGDIQSVLESTIAKAEASGATGDDIIHGEVKVNNVEPAGGVVPGTVKTAEELATEAANKETTEMNKSAQDNKTLATQILASLSKQAQEFNPMVTTPAAAENVAAAPVPNKIQVDNAQMTAFADATAQGVVPGGDGTINALFQTIVAKAVAQGGGSDDLINGEAAVPRMTAGVDGRPQVGETDMAKQAEFEDNMEKVAAVSALVEAGLDFGSAVDLVKQAEEDLAADAWGQEKQACLTMLMDKGVDFDQAVELVKQAEQELLAKDAE